MLGKESAVLADDESVSKPAPAFSKSVLKRFAVNVASLFSVQVANFLLPLLTVPYVVRIIGPERLGLLNFSLAYVTYFSLIINYGFDLAAVRAIAANRYDKVATSRIFSEVMAGKTILWGLSTIIFGVVTFSAPSFREHWLLHVCTYVTCISTVLSPFWVYQAMEDLGRVAMFNLLVKILFTGAIFLVIHQPDDYVWQNLVLSISQVLINAIALGVAAKRFGIRFFWPSVVQLVARFKADATLFFSNVMITLYASSTVFFLGILSTAYA
ncbi:MAG: flippase, partial [Cytophagaceae bacterium]